MNAVLKEGERVTSAMVRAALRLRFEPASHALLFEVANGTGGATRRFADAVAFGLWPSHGHKVEGIEIKVSRSDFLTEMKKPEKSDAIMRYCHHWWLACPKGMVKPDEIPPTWGLLEFSGDKLTARVRAPLLEAAAMPPTFIAALLRRHAGTDEDMAREAIARETTIRVKAAREEIERSVQRNYNSKISDAERALEQWEQIKAETGIDLCRFGVADDFIKAVQTVQKLGSGYNAALSNLRDGARRVAEALADFDRTPSPGAAGGE